MLRVPLLNKFSSLLLYKPTDTQFHFSQNSFIILQYNESYVSIHIIPIFGNSKEQYNIKYFYKIECVCFIHTLHLLIVVSEEGVSILTSTLDKINSNNCFQLNKRICKLSTNEVPECQSKELNNSNESEELSNSRNHSTFKPPFPEKVMEFLEIVKSSKVIQIKSMVSGTILEVQTNFICLIESSMTSFPKSFYKSQIEKMLNDGFELTTLDASSSEIIIEFSKTFCRSRIEKMLNSGFELVTSDFNFINGKATFIFQYIQKPLETFLSKKLKVIKNKLFNSHDEVMIGNSEFFIFTEFSFIKAIQAKKIKIINNKLFVIWENSVSVYNSEMKLIESLIGGSDAISLKILDLSHVNEESLNSERNLISNDYQCNDGQMNGLLNQTVNSHDTEPSSSLNGNNKPRGKRRRKNQNANDSGDKNSKILENENSLILNGAQDAFNYEKSVHQRIIYHTVLFPHFSLSTDSQSVFISQINGTVKDFNSYEEPDDFKIFMEIFDLKNQMILFEEKLKKVDNLLLNQKMKASERQNGNFLYFDNGILNSDQNRLYFHEEQRFLNKENCDQELFNDNFVKLNIESQEQVNSFLKNEEECLVNLFSPCRGLFDFDNLFTSSLSFIILKASFPDIFIYKSPKVIPYLRSSLLFDPNKLITQCNKFQELLDILESKDSSLPFKITKDSIYLSLLFNKLESLVNQIEDALENNCDEAQIECSLIRTEVNSEELMKDSSITDNKRNKRTKLNNKELKAHDSSTGNHTTEIKYQNRQLIPLLSFFFSSLILERPFSSFTEKKKTVKFLLKNITGSSKNEILKLIHFLNGEVEYLNPESLERILPDEKLGFLIYSVLIQIKADDKKNSLNNFDENRARNSLNNFDENRANKGFYCSIAEILIKFHRKDLASIAFFNEFKKAGDLKFLLKLNETIEDYVFINEGKFISKEYVAQLINEWRKMT